jgi:hypothetical protein
MPRPGEQAGRRLRTSAARLRAGVGRHRDCLLVGVAVVGLTVCATASMLIGARSLGTVLIVAVVAVFTVERIEAA